MHELAEETGWDRRLVSEHTAGHDRRPTASCSPGRTAKITGIQDQTILVCRETDHYDGGAPVEPIVVDGVRITPFVCYDLRFTDLFWNAAADTDLYLVPANWPGVRREHWMTLLRAGRSRIRPMCAVSTVSALLVTVLLTPAIRGFSTRSANRSPKRRPVRFTRCGPPSIRQGAEVRSTFRFMNDR